MSTTIQPNAPEAVKEETKEKATRNRKPLYPLAEGVKVEKTPEDFNPDTHRMTPAQFVDRPCFKEHQALMYEQKAAALRKEAAEWRINPPVKGATKKAKLVNRLSKLEAKLKELGVNVEELFSDDE